MGNSRGILGTPYLMRINRYDVPKIWLMTKAGRNKQKQGRVIRRYCNDIQIEDFSKWQDLIKTKAKGCGLYALYCDKRLMYVGLATKSIRSRVSNHISNSKKPFTHFSVYLVTGSNTKARARRIRDLEALLLNLVKPRPSWNSSTTHFVGAKKLKVAELNTEK